MSFVKNNNYVCLASHSPLSCSLFVILFCIILSYLFLLLTNTFSRNLEVKSRQLLSPSIFNINNVTAESLYEEDDSISTDDPDLEERMNEKPFGNHTHVWKITNSIDRCMTDVSDIDRS